MKVSMLVVLVLILGINLPSEGNILSNSGFEDEGSALYQAVNWEWMNPSWHGSTWGTATRESWRAHGGTWEATIRGNWAGDNNGGWWQEVPATSGVTYTFSAWFWADASWTNQSEQGMKIEFCSGTYSGETLVLQAATNFDGIGESWVQKTVSGVCPPGATWARVVVWANSVGSDGALQMDDFSLVAEPGTVILMSDDRLPTFPRLMLLIPLAALYMRRCRKEACQFETI